MVSLLPLLICSAFMVRSFQIKLRKDYKEEATIKLKNMEENLTTIFNKIDTISAELSVNENIVKTLYVKDIQKKKSMYLELYNNTTEIREYADFSLYSIGGICKYTTNNAIAIGSELPTYWGILRAARKEPTKLQIQRVEKTTSTREGVLLQASRAITDSNGNCIGFIVIDMDTNDFAKLFQGTFSFNTNLMLVDSYWHSIYSTESASERSIVPTIRKCILDKKNFMAVKKDCRIYMRQIDNTGLSIVLEQGEAFTSSITRSMYGISILMAALCFLLCVAVSLTLSRNLAKPMHTLTKAMKEVESGDLNVQIEVERRDEIGHLAMHFNRMIKELQYYMIKQIRQQKELNNASIAMMQAQLNPHFLYNTLDTMKWVAKANHIPEIAVLSSSLAKILRNSISSEAFVTVKEEMEFVKCYIDIQQIRFADRFDYEVLLPEELEHYKIPKLIVQPIVENAIIHGLADRDSGNIRVDIACEDDTLFINVLDDGCGMAKEVMEHLNSRNRDNLEGHLGFYNVDTIIRLYYGHEYGLNASDIESGGTKVTITLPLRKEVFDA
ncbi:cache domain-containing sensor histidine kinase [Anaerosporobacter faecicola]|uniref:cache domain-containing sensor histidine kinase n=1 Tax=Anaerosporobacter faecicola TaxID=2718714 RepID=UPI00143B9E2A|nr:sensor histidine kinase [Anaerosporobacter faecicola]